MGSTSKRSRSMQRTAAFALKVSSCIAPGGATLTDDG